MCEENEFANLVCRRCIGRLFTIVDFCYCCDDPLKSFDGQRMNHI